MIIFKIFFTKAQPSSLKNHEVFQLAFVTLISWNWGCYFMLAMLGTWRCKSLKASVKIATITTPNSSNFFVVPVFFFSFLFFFLLVCLFLLRWEVSPPKKSGMNIFPRLFFFFWTGFFSFFDLFAFLLRWEVSVPKMSEMDISLISLFFDFVLMNHILFCVFPKKYKQIFLS